MEEKKNKLISHFPNWDLLSPEQQKLLIAERTIQKFKAYDKERTEYVHNLEIAYNELKGKYDYITEQYYAEQEEPKSKREEKRRHKLELYDKIIQGEAAQNFMKKNMDGDEYTEDFKKLMDTYSLASKIEEVKRLHSSISLYKKRNRELARQLFETCKELREFKERIANQP